MRVIQRIARPPVHGLLLSALALAAPAAVAQALPAYNVDPRGITVSGVSSGGYMAVQLHVAYSATFSGLASIAGGPYYCAEDSLALALTRCLIPDEYDQPDPVRLAWITRLFASDGRLDPLEGMADDPVWIFSSPDDTVVRQRVSDRLLDYYRQFVDPARIAYVNTVRGEHSMPTRDFGFPCAYKGASRNPGDHFINNCGYDAAGQLLLHLHRRLRDPGDAAPTGQLLRFAQSAFLANPESHGMGPDGFAYVPAACAQGARCKLHVALHGCLQSHSRIGDVFVRNAGYNRWADANRMIVLYPQATASVQQGNGNGCWDWWSYDDAHYMWREGRQMAAIKAMVDRLADATTADTPPPAPQGLRATLALDRSLALEWQPSTDPRVTGYAVFRGSVAAGPFLQVGADAVAEPRLTLDQPLAGTQHYVVVAVTGSGVESVSSPAVVVTVPGL